MNWQRTWMKCIKLCATRGRIPLRGREHLCEIEGCTLLGVELWLPQWGLNDYERKPLYYCDEHMGRQGWCPGCLNFWGGIESFDFSRTGFCENCSTDIEQDEYGLDYDYYDNY